MNSKKGCSEIIFKNDSDFNLFADTITENLAKREKKCCACPDYRNASVLILLVNKNNSPHVVLTLRTDTVSTHKGQVSLPGGGVDETDKDCLFTALRETHEEIGVPPEKIKILGEFDDYISLAGFEVHVYAGITDYPVEYDPSADEIDIILEVPLSIFCNKEYYKCDIIQHNENEVAVYYYDWQGITIWGMTARILTDFAEIISDNGNF
jgi:8-oxo-dGTP pyrophosphatase MutT (NUDIX family)